MDAFGAEEIEKSLGNWAFKGEGPSQISCQKIVEAPLPIFFRIFECENDLAVGWERIVLHMLRQGPPLFGI